MAKDKNKITVLLNIKNNDIREVFEKEISAQEGFHISHKSPRIQNPGAYDLLILEIGEDSERELQYANTLKTAGVVKDIFLTSANTNPDILLEALRLGVREFFLQPVRKEEVRNALLKIKRKNENNHGNNTIQRGKIISVFGSKGGVGTTTIAVNLAVSLAGLKGAPSVALIDMKPIFGEISALLNTEPGFTWLEITRNISRLDPTYLMSALTRHSSGISLLSSPSELPEDYTADPQAVIALLKLMQTMFDFIIIDIGQSLDDNSKAIMRIADTVLLICILGLPCIMNLKKLQTIFQKQGYPAAENIEIVVNRFYKGSAISVKDAEESLHKKVLCCIPNAYKISVNAINQGKPVSTLAEKMDIGKGFRDLASTFSIDGMDEKLEKKGKSVFPLATLFGYR